MPQPDAAKFASNWKALFICPKPQIIRDLAPLLNRYLVNFSGAELNAIPSRHQITEAIAVEQPNLCFLEVDDAPDRSLAVIPDLLRADPKLPIIVLLHGNDHELVLRCL